MKDRFTDYETAKLLKQIGFDEPCLAEFYIAVTDFKDYSKAPSFNLGTCILDADPEFCNNNLKDWVSAPLWQQVEEWIFEKHKMFIYVGLGGKNGYSVELHKGSKYLFSIKNVSDSPILAKQSGLINAVKYLAKDK